MSAAPRSARLALKVVPKSSRDRVLGFRGESGAEVLRLAVTAPPERGKANASVVALLAHALGLPAAAIEVVAGHASPRKVVKITGLSATEIRERLAPGAGG